MSASTAIIVLASFFTFSVSQVTARADQSMLKSGEYFQYACPEKGICSALQESDDAAGLTHSGEEPYLGLINAYDGGGVGDPSWPAKCPVVLDKAGGTQPKVTGFYNDGTKETFVRLGDNSTSAVTTPENIIGCYADLQSLTSKIGNGYHIGTISRDASGYYWLNAQGVRFGLVLNGTVMDTDKSNPYYDDGHQFVLKTAATSTANPQIQAPGAGASNWAAKCPAVIDTVGGAQPKISGFKFDASGGENHMRLTDGGSTAVTSPGNLLGCYADIPSLNTPGQCVACWNYQPRCEWLLLAKRCWCPLGIDAIGDDSYY